MWSSGDELIEAEMISAFQRGGPWCERREIDTRGTGMHMGVLRYTYVEGGGTQDQQADTHQPRKQKRQPKSTKEAQIRYQLFLFSPPHQHHYTSPHHPLAKASRPPPARARAAGSCTAPGAWVGAPASGPSSRALPLRPRPRTAPVAMSRGGLGFGFHWERGGQRARTNKLIKWAGTP